MNNLATINPYLEPNYNPNPTPNPFSLSNNYDRTALQVTYFGIQSFAKHIVRHASITMFQTHIEINLCLLHLTDEK